MTPPARRYTVLGRLGEGGFGVVYRARLDGPAGFSKEVAIKLLREAEPLPATIARFRDEARIGGLVRNRAIVTVDPPVQLDGRWALVMELVDGVSCATLLQQGPVPLTVALEIVADVARTLHEVWHQAGPDGAPLQLVHRDLKPANLQITPAGDVRLLDFGIASARFDRAAHTTRHISGTPDYMAPERLRGESGPATDIYSLGVVLHEMVTGIAPTGSSAPTVDIDAEPAEDRPEDRVIELARAMRGAPAERPTASQVEAQCRELRAVLDGPSNRDWAAAHVPPRPVETRDDRVGRVLTEGQATPDRPPRTGSMAVVAVAGIGLAVLAVLALVPASPPPLDAALRQPFADMVMEYDAHLAERPELREPQSWDAELFASTVGHVAALQQDAAAWQRIDQVWSVWRDVVLALREAGLPEVIAGIPWVESHYTPELQSSRCAKGLWQFMPETAFAAGPRFGTPLVVRGCRFGDDDEASWAPQSGSVPVDPPYIGRGCRIPASLGCEIDDRSHIQKSTRAAVAMLGEPWNKRDFRASGRAVELTIGTHLAGIHAVETQDDVPDYVAAVLAAHFVAVCYYARNYIEEPAFDPWRKYNDGYCRSLDVPGRAAVAAQ